jgi:phosphosulfolactate synthase (CoM biosynthesis protein A)
MKLKNGQYVRHLKFGWGTILECQRHLTTVYFHRVGVKKLNASEAAFQVIEDQAALKRRGG